MAPHPGWMQGDHPSAPGPDTDPHDRRTSCRTLQRGRKIVDATDKKTGQGRGKDVERKSPKTDFPSQLAKARTRPGIRTFPPPLLRLTFNNRTLHLFSKADIFTC